MADRRSSAARVLALTLLSVPTALPDDARAPSFVGTKAGQVRDDNGLKMKLVWCPPGKFTMGGSPNPKKEKHPLDETQVRVTLTKGFWLGQHELTQAEWLRMMHTAPWSGQDYVKEGDNYPATYVDWDDATRFCGKLTEAERQAGRLPSGWQYTLPTEAQWEYACRAGTTTLYSFGDAASNVPEYEWFEKNTKDVGEEYAHQVGQKKPNGFGLHDMHGNVMEWCRDWYSPKLPGGTDPVVSTRPEMDPAKALPRGLVLAKTGKNSVPDDGSYRVFRGGSWFHAAWFSRSASRARQPPGFRLFNLGFRVALGPVGK
jgi:formylglycine-generating enzyme